MDSKHVDRIYVDDIRTGKGLLGYTFAHFGIALKTIAVLLPLFFILGCADIVLLRAIDNHFIRLLVQCLIGLIDGVLWCTAICMLHHRFVGHTMPLSHAFKQACERFVQVIMLLLCYVIVLVVYYELSVLVRYIFGHFNSSQGMKLLTMAVMLMLIFFYIAASVMMIMAFISILIEKSNFITAIKRSNDLVQAGWLKSFFIYIGFILITLFVLLPEQLQVMSGMPTIKALITSVVFALIIIPLWLTWYLITYNDLKLCHAEEEAEEADDDE